MRSRIPALDGLRGCACLLVFIGHFIASVERLPPFFPRVFSQYWSGVDLFFVLSGFVIFLSLLRLRAAAGDALAFLKAYASHRLFRIVPVYALLILSYILIPVLFRPLAQDSLFVSSIPRWCYFCFAQSLWGVIHQRAGAGYVNVTWSLCDEIFFYVIAFFVILWIRARLRIATLLGLIVFTYLCRVFCVFVANDLAAAYLLPVCRMDGFMMGGITAMLYFGGRLPMRDTRLLDRVLICMAAVYCLLAYNVELFFTPFSILFSYAFYSLFYCLVLVRVLSGGWAALSRGPLALFGVISYFVYLFQVPALAAAESYFSGVAAKFLSTLALVVGAASISWFCLERPLIRFGRSLNSSADTDAHANKAVQ